MKWITPIIAIVAIALLEAFAISKGLNGTAFSMAIALIAGLGGYMLHGQLRKK